MYTKENFKEEIVKFIRENEYIPEKVGDKAYQIVMEHIREVSQKLYDDLFYIAAMENGPEFEMTEEEFMDFLEKM